MHSLPRESGMWDGRGFIGSVLEGGLLFLTYSLAGSLGGLQNYRSV